MARKQGIYKLRPRSEWPEVGTASGKR
jgi:hypothetical protein